MDIELEDFKSAASALVSPNLYKSENSAWIEATSAVSCAH